MTTLALGTLETTGVPAAIEAGDAMCKAASYFGRLRKY
jgi:microcompartment protein CcmL/EutN